MVSTLRERFASDVFKTVIRENVRLAEAPSFGKPITLYDPRSAGAKDYHAAAAELAARVHKGIQGTKQRQRTEGKR